MNNSVRDIRITDFDYDLPDERIAKYPVPERDHSRLLVWRNGQATGRRFYEISDYFNPGDLLIYNNTRVIQARLRFRKSTGAEIEIFCLEPHLPADYERVFQAEGSCEWLCLVGNSKKWKEGPLTATVATGRGNAVLLTAERVGRQVDSDVIRFTWQAPVSFGRILESFGELPIPPYLNRPTEQSDKTTYQTVYSRIEGSVAAPTAGLHFTDAVLADLRARGVEEEEVTLHVGAGTFRPVKSDTIGGHPMHRETISVRRSTVQSILSHLGHITAVGTTSVRTLESLYYIGCSVAADPTERDLAVEQWQPYDTDYTLSTAEALTALINYMDLHGLTRIEAETRIIIVPGFRFRIVGRMITNFHQPKSTLLLLISAFVGGDDWRSIYRYALDNDFRFLSYGDSSLLFR